MLCLTLISALASCSKSVSYDTNYVLKPLVQAFSGGVNEPLVGVRAYAFAADTTEWTVATYQDALDGVLTSRVVPSQKFSEPLASSTPFELEGTVGWVQMSVSAPSLMILVVDTTNKLYAFTQQHFVENLPSLYVTIIFKLWKEGLSYKDGNWIFHNDFYTPPPTLKCFVAPTAQTAEGGAEAEISDVKVYAYAADTTLWRLASYQDALNGKITSKNDPKQTQENPTFKAFKEEGSALYSMTVSASPLMIVVVDKINKMYAYCKQEPNLKGESPTYPIVFRPWRKTYLYEENGWRVVDEQYRPKTSSGTMNSKR